MPYAEHNGSYRAAYKNLFDWTLRIDTKVFQSKPIVCLSTSPGVGGAANVLAAAIESALHFGVDVRASVSVPSFYDNFDVEASRILNPDSRHEIHRAMQLLSPEHLRQAAARCG